MRKSLILFLICFLTAVGGVSYVHTMLLAEKDQVQITEKTIYGDKSVLEGISIVRNAKYDKFIRWNTNYIVGASSDTEKDSCKTEYRFDEYGRFQDEANRKFSGIELHTTPNINFDEEDSALKLVGLDKAMRELFDETEPGQEGRKVIYLADYLDFYKYDIWIDLPEDVHFYSLDEAELKRRIEEYEKSYAYKAQLEEELRIAQAFTEFFKIPVIGNHVYEISVGKTLEGDLYGWGYSNVGGGGSSGGVTISGVDHIEDADGFDLAMYCTYTDEGCYFTFNTHTWQNQIVDTSYIPGGYGIYYLPFDKEEKTIDVEHLQMVYALEPRISVFGIHYDEKRNQIRLFTERETGCFLTVIDAETMETRQELCYADGYGTSYFDEDFMVLENGDNGSGATVLSIDEAGNCQIELIFDTSKLIEKGIPYLDYERMAFDWNGEVLVMGASLIGESYFYNQSCGFYLAAFDKKGLAYYGEYRSSLDTGMSYDDYYFNCMPVDSDALQIHWQ